MAFNNEKFRLFWRFDSDAGAFVASSTAQGYDVDNLKRDTLGSKWKSLFPESSTNINGDFETGDFTGWDQNSGVISGTAHSGSWASQLTAIGSDLFGARNLSAPIDQDKMYTIISWNAVSVYTAGTYFITISFRDENDINISGSTVKSYTATSVYDKTTKTIGPSGSGADLTTPAGARFVSVQQAWSGGAPVGVAQMDDVSIKLAQKAIIVDLDSAIEKVVNGGFETGDFTGWEQVSSVITTGFPHSGVYTSALVSTGSDVFGCRSNANIDPTKTYLSNSWHKVNWTAGNYVFGLVYYDQPDGDGTVLLSQDIMTVTTNFNLWTLTSVTIGPVGSGADFEFPAGTKSITMRPYWTNTPTGTGRMDDVTFAAVSEKEITAFALLDHNIESGDTIILRYANDDTFVVDPGSMVVTQRDDTLIEYFASVTRRYWRLDIITDGQREAGRLLLGDHYQMERNIGLGWSGPQHTQDTSRSTRTAGGQSYSDIGTALKTFRGEFIAHGETDLDEVEALKLAMLTGQAFIISQNWEDFPVKRTLYGKLRSLGQPNNIAADKWTIPLTMLEQK